MVRNAVMFRPSSTLDLHDDGCRSRAGSVHELKRRAELLLQELLRNRSSSEARLAERGARDHMKTVRGESALDQAVAETEALLQQLHASEEASQRMGHVSCAVEIEVKGMLPLPALHRIPA